MGHWSGNSDEGRLRSQTPPCMSTNSFKDDEVSVDSDDDLHRCKSLPDLAHLDQENDAKVIDPLIRCRGHHETCQFRDNEIRQRRTPQLKMAFISRMFLQLRRLRNRVSGDGASHTVHVQHNNQLLSDEQRLRFKLDYHFMTPYQKYKRGRKPWKLAIQILKIIMVTTQISLFGADRFASVSFFQHTEKALSHMLILNFDDVEGFSLYSRQDLVDALYFANSSYNEIKDTSLGLFDYENFKEQPPPMEMCELSFVRGTQNASAESYSYDDEIETVCANFSSKLNISKYVTERHIFDRLIAIELRVKIHSIYLNGMNFHHQPECFLFDVKIVFDNKNHDGRLRVAMDCIPNLMPTCPAVYVISDASRVTKTILVAFDIAVVIICSLSCALCIRSLKKSIHLSKVAKAFFEEHRDEEFTKWDMLEFINKWFPVIVISDCLSIIGSIYKVFVDERDLEFYNICSILLGLGVILVWIGLLRFLAYLKAYNILLITLRSAAPSLLRFMVCALFIFLGFTLCGWVVLGPYHDKFREFFVTAQCLFSLLNGDDMFPTFSDMSKTNTMIWIFSKIYLYIFISLFIYVVLSTFISIVGDTYERIKDWGRLPQTKIQRFIEGRKNTMTRQQTASGECHRCVRAMSSTEASSLSEAIPSRMTPLDTLSQLSVESTSWE